MKNTSLCQTFDSGSLLIDYPVLTYLAMVLFGSSLVPCSAISLCFPRCSRLLSTISLDMNRALFRRTFSSSISLLEIEVMRSLIVVDSGFSISTFSRCSCSSSMQEILSLTDSCMCSPDFFLTTPFQAISLAGQVGLKWEKIKTVAKKSHMFEVQLGTCDSGSNHSLPWAWNC